MDFDIDGYVISSPDGSLNPGDFTGLVAAGETGWEIVAPTADAISELNLTSSTLFSEGGKISLGTGYTPGAAEDAGLTFEYTLAGSDTTMFGFVQYVTGFSADFNNDDKVDGVDLSKWQGAFGVDASADADGDGDSDGADFLAWQQQHLSGVPLQATSEAVPEPSVWLLLTAGFPGLAMMRRRS
jgi:hypothetical protein